MSASSAYICASCRPTARLASGRSGPRGDALALVGGDFAIHLEHAAVAALIRRGIVRTAVEHPVAEVRIVPAIADQRLLHAEAPAREHRAQGEHVVFDPAFHRREVGQQRAADRHRGAEHRGELAASQQPRLVDLERRAAHREFDRLAARVDVVDERADDLRVGMLGERREQDLHALRIRDVVARLADEHVARRDAGQFREMRAQAEIARRAANGHAMRAAVAFDRLARGFQRAVGRAIVGDDDLARDRLRQRGADRLRDHRLHLVGDDEDRRCRGFGHRGDASCSVWLAGLADLRFHRGDRGHVDHAARRRRPASGCAPACPGPSGSGRSPTPSVITRTML